MMNFQIPSAGFAVLALSLLSSLSAVSAAPADLSPRQLGWNRCSFENHQSLAPNLKCVDVVCGWGAAEGHCWCPAGSGLVHDPQWNRCNCPEGETYNGPAGKCEKSKCPTGQSPSPDGKCVEVICGWGAAEGHCWCPRDSGLEFNWEVQECECPADSTYNKEAGKCETKAKRDDSASKCPAHHAPAPNGECIEIICGWGALEGRCFCSGHGDLVYNKEENKCENAH